MNATESKPQEQGDTTVGMSEDRGKFLVEETISEAEEKALLRIIDLRQEMYILSY